MPPDIRIVLLQYRGNGLTLLQLHCTHSQCEERIFCLFNGTINLSHCQLRFFGPLLELSIDLQKEEEEKYRHTLSSITIFYTPFHFKNSYQPPSKLLRPSSFARFWKQNGRFAILLHSPLPPTGIWTPVHLFRKYPSHTQCMHICGFHLTFSFLVRSVTRWRCKLSIIEYQKSNHLKLKTIYHSFLTTIFFNLTLSWFTNRMVRYNQKRNILIPQNLLK